MSLCLKTNCVTEAEPPHVLGRTTHSIGTTPVPSSLTFAAGHGLMPCSISLADSSEGQQFLAALHGRIKNKQTNRTLLAVQSLIFPSSRRYIILSVHLPIAVREFPCSNLFQLLASPFAAFPPSCVCHRLQIIHSKSRYKQPATLKT